MSSPPGHHNGAWGCVVLEILARRPGSRIPTVGEWLGYLMRPKLGRFLVLAGWMWLGWHYFAR